MQQFVKQPNLTKKERKFQLMYTLAKIWGVLPLAETTVQKNYFMDRANIY